MSLQWLLKGWAAESLWWIAVMIPPLTLSCSHTPWPCDFVVSPTKEVEPTFPSLNLHLAMWLVFGLECQQIDVTEGLKRAYVIGLCHYPKKNMPRLTHWSQNKCRDSQKVWNKTNHPAEPHLNYPIPTWPSDTWMRNWVEPGTKAGLGSLSLWGHSGLISAWISVDMKIWLAKLELSGHSWANQLWPGRWA